VPQSLVASARLKKKFFTFAYLGIFFCLPLPVPAPHPCLTHFSETLPSLDTQGAASLSSPNKKGKKKNCAALASEFLPSRGAIQEFEEDTCLLTM
jgi:hypothetical protein